MKRIIPLSAFLLIVCIGSVIHAGSPTLARYTYDNDALFWFVFIADTHIGDDIVGGNQDTEYLEWATSEAFYVIQPEFMVNGGDLTDSTNGGLIPDGPHQAEWNTYKSIVNAAAMHPEIYYDTPGNHDQYSDGDLSYYLNNSIQGVATGMTQQSWTREFDFGKYHFFNVCTPASDGLPWPFDFRGLESYELDHLESELETHIDANLTIVFGHHPVFDWYYGDFRFKNLLEQYHVSAYVNGHKHDYWSRFEDTWLSYAVTSLAKSDDNHLAVFAMDNDGLSVAVSDAKDWPIVLVTAPTDKKLGNNNPYAYVISANATDNPVRALAFDANPISAVEFQVDEEGPWLPMQSVKEPLWLGQWDCSSLSLGNHILTVRALGTRSKQHTITVELAVTACDDGLDNDGDGKIDFPEDDGCYSPSDPDEYQNNAPFADAGEDQVVEVGETVSFDGSGSYDPDPDDTLTFSWDFDDSDGIDVNSTSEQTTTIYDEPGTYTVTLLVTDLIGSSHNDTCTVVVNEPDDDDMDDDGTDDDTTPTDDDISDDDDNDSNGQDDDDDDSSNGCGCIVLSWLPK